MGDGRRFRSRGGVIRRRLVGLRFGHGRRDITIRRHKVKNIPQAGILKWRLPVLAIAAGHLLHFFGHLRVHVRDAEALLGNVFGQGDGVGAAIGGSEGHLLRGGGESDKRPLRIHGGHARVRLRFGEVVPAAVEEDDIRLVLRLLHAAQHALRGHGLLLHIAGFADAGTFGDEIVLSLKLAAVAGEVEQRHAVILRHFLTELLNGLFGFHQRRVFHHLYLKAHALQRGLHALEVRRDARQLPQSEVSIIVSHTHYEGDAVLRPGGEHGGQKNENRSEAAKRRERVHNARVVVME